MLVLSRLVVGFPVVGKLVAVTALVAVLFAIKVIPFAKALEDTSMGTLPLAVIVKLCVVMLMLSLAVVMLLAVNG